VTTLPGKRIRKREGKILSKLDSFYLQDVMAPFNPLSVSLLHLLSVRQVNGSRKTALEGELYHLTLSLILLRPCKQTAEFISQSL
jgi:hypothetical protein